jgi:hypothetical protein
VEFRRRFAMARALFFEIPLFLGREESKALRLESFALKTALSVWRQLSRMTRRHDARRHFANRESVIMLESKVPTAEPIGVAKRKLIAPKMDALRNRDCCIGKVIVCYSVSLRRSGF